MCRGREDGEAGNLVVLQQFHVSLRVRVGHLDHHRCPIVEKNNLRPDMYTRRGVLAGPLGDPNHASRVVLERKLSFRPHRHLLGFPRSEVNVVEDGARSDWNPLLTVVPGTSLAMSLVATMVTTFSPILTSPPPLP